MFTDLSLDPRLLRSVQHLGFVKPTEIQQEAIPAVMVGRDLIVSSQTGSGKTLAYLLPMMQRLKVALITRLRLKSIYVLKKLQNKITYLVFIL